ncbi:MAG: ABC transporter substrate binding protein [Thermodesulfobacteriota bacterium]|nr:ABC transporter substrate binding protein [Thermodesulfobacteriota bacterium]
MIKKVFLILSIFILWHGLVEAGYDIVAVQSTRIPPYEDAIKGFRSICNFNIRRIIISESTSAEVVRKIRRIQPDLILAIGMDAFSVVKGIRDTSIVYLMVLNPQSLLSGEKNITGVSMNIPQRKQLLTLLKLLPHIKSIGLIYNPKNTGHLAERAKDAAKKAGVSLMATEIHSPKEVPSALQKMKGRIDTFWMLPDYSVITKETLEFLLLFSIESRIPILTFSEKYVELGALISIGIDSFDMGVQAGEMAKKILSGINVTGIQRVEARKLAISVNLKVAEKLEIRIDKNAMKGVKIID